MSPHCCSLVGSGGDGQSVRFSAAGIEVVSACIMAHTPSSAAMKPKRKKYR